MDAEYLNELCIEACETHYGFDPDEPELLSFYTGKKVTPSKLHKRGLPAVVEYWRNKETVGGRILWDLGYYVELPDEAVTFFDNFEKILAKAIKEACKNL